MSTINTNLQALSTAMTLNRDQGLQSEAVQSLSTGTGIVSPAGTATADSLSADNLRLSAASTNVQNTLSYTQSAEGDLSVMSTILDRMNELATDSQDPTKNSSDNANYEVEFKQLQDQLRSMIGGSSADIGGSSVTSPSGMFNGATLFGSTASGGQTVGIGDTASDQITIPDINLQAGAIVSLIQQDSSGNYTLSSGDSDAVSSISSADQQVANGQATLGGAQARLTLAASNLTVQQQNISSAISGISDVDVAQESTQLAKYNLLMQSAAAMLVQANVTPQSVLKLIKS
jgi:flagellin